MADREHDFIYKVVTIGKSSVGKSSLISRFCRNEFNLCSRSTIGVEFSIRSVTLQDGRVAKLQIWDTAGQEEFRAITKQFYRSAKAAVVVYDICEASTFNDVHYWIDELREYAPKDIPIILVGNKSDRTYARCITEEEGLQKAVDVGAFSFVETSALENSNVVDLFERVANEIHQHDLPCLTTDYKPNNDIKLSEDTSSDLPPSRGKCCE